MTEKIKVLAASPASKIVLILLGSLQQLYLNSKGQPTFETTQNTAGFSIFMVFAKIRLVFGILASL
ncbi:MAG: hypothetical protein Q4C55_06235 [Eubacterium sp.]|nr:hypothetical protein [Eubacterium sp.]